MEPNASQNKQASFIAIAEATISLPNEKNIICTWVGLQGPDLGDEEVIQWKKENFRNAVNEDCRKRSRACRLMNRIFNPAGERTCWNCDFRREGIDQESLNIIEGRIDGNWGEGWQDILRPHCRNHDEEVVLLRFNKFLSKIALKKSPKSSFSVTENSGPKTIDKSERKIIQTEKNNNGGRNAMTGKGHGHSRCPQHYLDFGGNEEEEDLGKISTPKAQKIAQARANELGQVVALWKYVKSKGKRSHVGTFNPAESENSGEQKELEDKVAGNQAAARENSSSQDATSENTSLSGGDDEQPQENDTDIVSHSAESGDDSLSLGVHVSANLSVLLAGNEEIFGNGFPKDFYILEGPMNDCIVGGYLIEEQVELAQQLIDAMNQIFPGKIKLVKSDLSVSQQQGLINVLLSRDA